MRIGAHVSDDDPIKAATESDAAASLNNRIRIPSRKLVAQHAAAAATIGAHGLVVHGGHVTKSENSGQGVENWRKMFARQSADGGFDIRILVENTAGGDNAMALKRRLGDRFRAGFVLYGGVESFAFGDGLTCLPMSALWTTPASSRCGPE